MNSYVNEGVTSIPAATAAGHGLIEGDLTNDILGAAIDVHRELGAGLLESAYQACMCRELGLKKIPFRSAPKWTCRFTTKVFILIAVIESTSW